MDVDDLVTQEDSDDDDKNDTEKPSCGTLTALSGSASSGRRRVSSPGRSTGPKDTAALRVVGRTASLDPTEEQPEQLNECHSICGEKEK